MADAVAIFTPGQRLISASGVPYANCTISFYNAGSDDPKEVFSDANLQNTLGSIVYTDSAGYPVTASGGSTKTQVFTGTGAYKIVIADSGTGETTTHDDCVGAVISGAGGGGASGITQAEADLRYIRNANALSAITDLADADIFPLWKISGSGNRGITYAGLKTELTTDFRADGRMFPVGTRMVFQQTTPPTGWTKETGAAYNDAALRFTTGTAGTGGTQSYNAVFKSWTFSGTVGNDTPSIAKTAAHAHVDAKKTYNGVGGGSGDRFLVDALSTVSSGNNQDTPTTSTSVGSGTAHDHSLTMNAANFAVKYVEMCVAQKA